jgi:cyclohexyl-isocyanide hydratase
MRRREFGKVIVGTTVFPSMALAQNGTERPAAPSKPLTVGMLTYPDLTLLDLIGPQTVLSTHANIHLIWKSKDVIYSDRGVGIKPDTTVDECPAELDVLFVPGGPGMLPVMKDRQLLDFLKKRAEQARFVTSVCTGSLILGAAGLLKGYKATSHWAAVESLAAFGAEPVHQRVVVDRNRVTGGGVTSGIDFGLALLAMLRGDIPAKVTQLAMEYDPQPPFSAGSPELAGPAVTQLVLNVLAPLQEQTRETIALITKSGGPTRQ